MVTDFDPYGSLQVSATAGQDEIEQAYERMAAIVREGGMNEESRRAVDAAYLVLHDPEQRRAYDDRRAEAIERGAAMPTEEGVETHSISDKDMSWDAAPWRAKEVAFAILAGIGLTLVSMIPFIVLAVLVAGDADNIENDPEALAITLAGSAVFQVSILGTAWWFAVRKYRIPWSELGLRWPDRGSWWLPFLLVAGALGVLFLYGLILQLLDFEPKTDLPDATYDNALPLAVAMVLTVLIAPVIEETFFRGFVFRGLARSWGLVWGALGSAVLFGTAHALNPDGIYVIAAIAAIGLWFAWGAYYSRSVVPSMAAHLMFNLLQMIVATLNH